MTPFPPLILNVDGKDLFLIQIVTKDEKHSETKYVYSNTINIKRSIFFTELEVRKYL